MDKYYYFISQLPFLIFDRQKNLNINAESFLDEASKWLAPKKLEILKKCSIKNYEGLDDSNHITREYKNFENSLYKFITAKRSKPNKKEADLYNIGVIIDQGNPLETEIGLLKLHWNYIEELESGRNFDFEKVICYYLKLQIIERLLKFNKENGTKIFDTLCEVKI